MSKGMNVSCPYCTAEPNDPAEARKIQRFGCFFRKSDQTKIQRYFCLVCRRSFSAASFDPCLHQNKRHLNEVVRELLCSGVSQRRATKILKISRITVVRKLLFLAKQAERGLREFNERFPPVRTLEFDDLETFEHTKCKPLSVTLAVESGSRRIIGFEVSKMPANGPLAEISRKKYGRRPDERPQARDRLFSSIKPLVSECARIKSDQNPHYSYHVKKHFPKSEHLTFKGRKGCIVGQGELKKIGFDPLFSLNHTCAMLRANVNRLTRRTWCTTKRPDRLAAHLMIQVLYLNEMLKPKHLEKAC